MSDDRDPNRPIAIQIKGSRDISIGPVTHETEEAADIFDMKDSRRISVASVESRQVKSVGDGDRDAEPVKGAPSNSSKRVAEGVLITVLGAALLYAIGQAWSYFHG